MKIYYFTRTRRSEKIANELASKYGCTCHKINDNKNWSGAMQFIKGCISALKKESLEISYDAIEVDEKILLVFPVWCSTYPPAVRQFLAENGKIDIIGIPTSNGSKLKTRSHFTKIYDLVGRKINIDKIKI